MAVSTFTDPGAYAVKFHAQDVWGGVSYPKQIYINQTQSDEQILITCGDGDYDANSPWAFSDHLAQMAYETARAWWLIDSKITWLSSGSHAGVDGAPTQSALQSAMDGDGPDCDDVTPAELDSWLNGLDDSTLVIVVLDFQESGAWASALAATGLQDRIVIASCSGSEDSWCEEGRRALLQPVVSPRGLQRDQRAGRLQLGPGGGATDLGLRPESDSPQERQPGADDLHRRGLRHRGCVPDDRGLCARRASIRVRRRSGLPSWVRFSPLLALPAYGLRHWRIQNIELFQAGSRLTII